MRALVVLLLCVAPAAHADLNPLEARAFAIFKELVEIDTTHATGDNTAAARAAAAHLLAAGFAPEDVRVIEPAPRKGNLVARYRAPVPTARPILFLAHIDVVPANPADWTVEPFKLLERDGYYWGRGTLDDKDEAAFAVANLIRLKEEGYRPNRDIIIALTADEEGGPHNGVRHLLSEHRDLVDAAFVINEGGGGGLLNGKPIGVSVQAAEKVYQTYTLEVTNRGGHSSLPRADNAIYDLAEALVKIRAHEFPVALNDVTRSYFRALAQSPNEPRADAIARLLKNPDDAAAQAAVADDSGINSRLRTTCVATKLNAGHAENALPQRAQATVNCRILPGVPPEEVQATLARVIGNDAVSITPVDVAYGSPASPLTEEVMAPVQALTDAMWPGTPVVPIMSTGATDALWFRNAGIPVYGVSGVMSDVNDVRIHGRDERILIESFKEGLEFQYQLAKQLTGG